MAGNILFGGRKMITLSILLFVTFVVSGITRWCGASRVKTAGVGLVPVVVLLVYLAVGDRLEIGPHGGIIPPWMTVVAGLGFALVPACVAAWLIPKKEPIQLPETTRGK